MIHLLELKGSEYLVPTFAGFVPAKYLFQDYVSSDFEFSCPHNYTYDPQKIEIVGDAVRLILRK